MSCWSWGLIRSRIFFTRIVLSLHIHGPAGVCACVCLWAHDHKFTPSVWQDIKRAKSFRKRNWLSPAKEGNWIECKRRTEERRNAWSRRRETTAKAEWHGQEMRETANTNIEAWLFPTHNKTFKKVIATFYSFQGFRRITKNSATVFNIDNGKNVNWVY